MTDSDENANVADDAMKNLLSHVPAEEAADVMAEEVEAMTDITDEMIEAAARAQAKEDGYDWDQVSAHWQGRYRDVASAGLTAALTGRTVVDPEPSQRYTAFDLKPDDVLLIGGVTGGQQSIEAFMAWAKSEWPGRKVVCFSDDIDIRLLHEFEEDGRG